MSTRLRLQQRKSAGRGCGNVGGTGRMGGAMSVLCKLGRHRSASMGVWNDGLFFGTCERCSAPLIRRPDESWMGVPRDYVVVWSERRPTGHGTSAAS